MTAPSATSKTPPIGLGAIVATISGNLYLVVATLFYSVLALLVAWVPPRGSLVWSVARAWSRGLLIFAGVRLEVEQGTELEDGSRYIFMANHQSLFDIPALIAAAPTETRFLAKRSLFKIPLFGWAMSAARFISIERGDGERAQKGFLTALHELREGASVLVFPEATRSLDGRLLPFKRGGLLLALRSGLPIVPVGVRGSLQVQGRDSYWIRPGTVGVRYGRPIDPKSFGVRGINELEAKLRDEISKLAGLG